MRGAGPSTTFGPTAVALGEDLLAVVLAELAEVAPATVVVEDLETLVSPIVLDELGHLAERAPDGIGFVFVSRDDRLPRMPRLRLRGDVVELRAGDLALSVDETEEAIRKVSGRRLHPVQVQALHARTEGWAAGVQLAAVGLRDHVDPDRFVADFAGDDRHVADYLSGEVLAVQPPEVTRVPPRDRRCWTGSAVRSVMRSWAYGRSAHARASSPSTWSRSRASRRSRSS